MAKMNWDKVNRQNRVNSHGSVRAWSDLPQPESLKKKKKKKATQQQSGKLSVRTIGDKRKDPSRKKRATQSRKPKRTGLVKPAGFDDELKAIMKGKGWLSFERVVAELKGRRTASATPLPPLNKAQIIARLKAQTIVYSVDGERARYRPRRSKKRKAK